MKRTETDIDARKYEAQYESPLGTLTLCSDGAFLTGLYFGAPGRGREQADLPVFAETRRWLGLYFGGKDPGFFPPIKLYTTPFCKRVCELLRAIPYGQTSTYGAIAMKLAKERGIAKMSAQAVGGAVGRNPVAIIIPCHRVIGADGSLVGYGGGLERKTALLEMERT